MKSRALFNSIYTMCGLTLLLVFTRLIFAPDAGAKLFSKAQNFESIGQSALALSHYELLAQTQPQSAYATRALLKIGDLLAAQGRASGDRKMLRSAVAAYEKLAANYPDDPLAGEALLDAGQLCAENLDDAQSARRFYGLLLKNAAPSSSLAAQATLKLGLLALQGGEGKSAQGLLQRVLQKWPKNLETASEAQFRLGVLYETLFKNRDWATRAYDAVIANYPNSPWANDARGRLGLLAFADAKNRRPARRVMLEIAPIPGDGISQPTGSLWDALPLLLVARGMETDATTLRAWSLEPFWCALDTQNPGAVVKPSFDDFENAVANAGLRFTIKGGGKPDAAMDDLQNDVDNARLPLVFFKGKDGPRWALCVGYDSARGELFLQAGGARFETVAAKTFATSWNEKGPWGKSFTLLSFYAPGEQNRPKPNLTPAPLPSPKPGETPLPILEASPTFAWELAPLSRKIAHRKTLRRAASLLERGGNGAILPNIAGLTWLESQLQTTSRRVRRPLETAPEIPAATPEIRASETPDPLATPDVFASPESTPSEISPEETLAPPPAPREVEEFESSRARAVLAFFGDAARNWATKRREAARFLRLVANQTGERNWQNAAREFEQSALDIESAIPLAQSEDAANLREIRRLVTRAREAEVRAAQLLR